MTEYIIELITVLWLFLELPFSCFNSVFLNWMNEECVFKASGKRRKWRKKSFVVKSRGMKGGEGRGWVGGSQSEPSGQQSMNMLGDGAVGGGSICQSPSRVIGSRCEAVWPLRQRGVKGRIKSSVQNWWESLRLNLISCRWPTGPPPGASPRLKFCLAEPPCGTAAIRQRAVTSKVYTDGTLLISPRDRHFNHPVDNGGGSHGARSILPRLCVAAIVFAPITGVKGGELVKQLFLLLRLFIEGSKRFAARSCCWWKAALCGSAA